MTLDWQRLEREVRRVHTRYQREVVEALGLCPWARDTRERGAVHMHVSFIQTPDIAAALELIDVTMAGADTSIGILVFPLLALDRLDFSHFLAAVRAQNDALRRERKFALADFHPNAPSDTTSPERLVPLLRRAPDPMFQIVPTSVLERVRPSDDHGTTFIDAAQLSVATLAGLSAAPPSLASRIARANARTVDRVGLGSFEALLADIHHDRNTSYASLGLPAPPWAAGNRENANF
jgi:hypothetical protein